MKQLIVIVAVMALVACSQKEKQNENEGATQAISQTEQTASAPVEKQDTAAPEVNSNLPTVIDFSASWCGPCKMFAPVFHEVAEKYKDKANFKTIDVDEDGKTSDQYRIAQVPTVVFLDKDGKEVNRLVGVPQEAEFVKALEAVMNQK